MNRKKQRKKESAKILSNCIAEEGGGELRIGGAVDHS